MITADQVKNLIKVGETENIKFLGDPKSPLEIYDSIKALQDEEKGVILIGVNPDQTVVGIRGGRKKYELLLEKASESFDKLIFKSGEISLIRFFSIFFVEISQKQSS